MTVMAAPFPPAIHKEMCAEWAGYTEEEKYVEWSEAADLGMQESYEEYCDYWDGQACE